ncbi:MAG: serine/threonine-protein kinase [Deltaproteobacteria bacterium]|nr:serine/threonine-protein kinase [Deltaproteobacteria bacterium]
MGPPSDATLSHDPAAYGDGSPAVAEVVDPAVLPPGTVIDRYEIVALAGRGAMGIVYRARDTALDREVALKLVLVPAGGLDEARARLRRESQAMARIDDPAVVRVYDVGAAGDHLFVAMELMTGGTLRAWIAQRRSWREVVGMMVHAGRGLAAAHAAGLVHRDFKPANVLLDRTGRARVSDFGLARTFEVDRDEVTAPTAVGTAADAVSQALTVTGAVVGTIAYMAPEQMRGRAVDARADQFAFCVTAWEALHGTRPFDTAARGLRDLPVLLDAIDAGRILRPSEARAAPARVRELLVRGLAADPARRWPSLGALLDALERAATRRVAPVLVGAAIAATAAVGIAVAAGRGSDDAPARGEPVAPPGTGAVALVAGGAPLVVGPPGEPVPELAMAADGARLMQVVDGAISIHERDGGAATTVPVPVVGAVRRARTGGAPGGLVVATRGADGCTWWYAPPAGREGSPIELARAADCEGEVADVARDGHRAAIARGDRLVVRDLGTGIETTVVAGLDKRTIAAPRWSPSGARLAFTTLSSRPEVRVVDARSGALLALRPDGHDAIWLDDARLVYAIDVMRTGSLHLLDLAAAPSAEPLATLDGQVRALDVGTDGLLVTTVAGIRSMYVTDAAPARPREIGELRRVETRASEDVLVAGWTRDGDIVTVSGDRRSLAFVRSGPTHHGDPIGPMSGTFAVTTRTTHGIVYVVKPRAGTQVELRLFDPDTGADRRWATADDWGALPKVTCAATRPICLSRAGAEYRWIDAATGAVGERVPAGLPVEGLQPLSPDGTELLTHTADRLTLIRIADGHATTIVPRPALRFDPHETLDWGPDGRFIYHAEFDDRRGVLYRIARDGTAEPILVAPFHQLMYPVVSPRGDRVGLTVSSERSAVLFLPFAPASTAR